MLLEALSDGLRKLSVEDDYRLRLSESGMCARALAFERRLWMRRAELEACNKVIADQPAETEPEVLAALRETLADLGTAASGAEGAEPTPDRLRVCGEMGHKLEALVCDWLEAGGVKVEHRQREVAFKIRDDMPPVLGHIDGIVEVAKSLWTVDVKGVGEGTFRHVANALPLDWDFPNAVKHREQAHSYTAALRAEGVNVQGTILLYVNRSSGEVRDFMLSFDSRAVDRIRARLLRVVADAGEAREELREYGLDGGCLARACEWCDWQTPCWGPTKLVKIGRRNRRVLESYVEEL